MHAQYRRIDRDRWNVHTAFCKSQQLTSSLRAVIRIQLICSQSALSALRSAARHFCSPIAIASWS